MQVLICRCLLLIDKNDDNDNDEKDAEEAKRAG